MLELAPVARPSCVIGVSVWVSVLDKPACPNWVVESPKSRTDPHPKPSPKHAKIGSLAITFGHLKGGGHER